MPFIEFSQLTYTEDKTLKYWRLSLTILKNVIFKLFDFKIKFDEESKD